MVIDTEDMNKFDLASVLYRAIAKDMKIEFECKGKISEIKSVKVNFEKITLNCDFESTVVMLPID